jgi:hypothetical protein
MTAEERSFDPRLLPTDADEAPQNDGAGVPQMVASAPGSPDESLSAGPLYVPVLPLKDTVIFPDTMMPLAVGQPR